MQPSLIDSWLKYTIQRAAPTDRPIRCPSRARSSILGPVVGCPSARLPQRFRPGFNVPHCRALSVSFGVMRRRVRGRCLPVLKALAWRSGSGSMRVSIFGPMGLSMRVFACRRVMWRVTPKTRSPMSRGLTARSRGGEEHGRRAGIHRWRPGDGDRLAAADLLTSVGHDGVWRRSVSATSRPRCTTRDAAERRLRPTVHLGSISGRVLGRSRSLRRHLPSQTSATDGTAQLFGMCNSFRGDVALCAGRPRSDLKRRQAASLDPADFVRPRALLDAVRRSPKPMRRANQPEEVKCCAETGVDAGEVDHQHGHPRFRGPRPVWREPGSRRHVRSGVPREYVAFGPKLRMLLSRPQFWPDGARKCIAIPHFVSNHGADCIGLCRTIEPSIHGRTWSRRCRTVWPRPEGSSINAARAPRASALRAG